MQSKVEICGVNTAKLTVLKNDEEGNILPGAEFTLTGDGVNIVLVTVTTFTEDAEGAYWKLKNGTYTTTPPTSVSYPRAAMMPAKTGTRP